MKNNGLTNNIDMREEDRYEEFEQSIINHFNSLVDKNTPLFTTNAENLWETYLNNLPIEGRQHYNCNCCRHFIQRYGNLVVVTEKGTLESVLWAKDIPPFFKESVRALRKIVNNSRITGVFISDDKTLGTPRTGIWGHLHVVLPVEKVNNSRLNTAYQVIAEKLEDYRMLNRALQEYSLETVTQAMNILQSESLYRGERILGVAKWFKDIYSDRLNASNNRIKENITWVYVATAPNGFCHVKSSMIGTLLDDIQEGLSFESVKRRFDEKMNPSNYMRSQVAPTQGNILQAEKIVEKMGIANSLRRRYARFEEIPCFIWKNRNNKNAKEEVKKFGVFSNIAPKGKTANQNNINLPSTVMTWEKFQRTILPTAENIEAKIDDANKLMALVTASDETSENILQWNNPFSWYYHGGIDSEIRKRVENAGGKYEDNEIRCSLIWEGLTDLDLHCVTPRGHHIYYSRYERRYDGGELDVDMNGMDRNSRTPVENIRFANNAPEGRYTFYVNNFTEKENYSKGTPFKVELEINGQVYSYVGKPLKDNEKITVFEFNYFRGQQPNISSNSSFSLTSTEEWNISDEFVKVNGITTSPNLWNEKQLATSGAHIFFLLDECKDLSEGKGRGFFNEMLKPELREIRKTLEAYTANSPIENIDGATACGIGCSKDNEFNLTLRVTINGMQRLIKIDRWD